MENGIVFPPRHSDVIPNRKSNDFAIFQLPVLARALPTELSCGQITINFRVKFLFYFIHFILYNFYFINLVVLNF